MMRLACLLAALVLLGSGCGVKTAYNNLDRIVPWYVGDYVDLDRAQRERLDTGLDGFLAWHRATELPAYASYLRSVNRELADGLTEAELETLETVADDFFERVLDRLLPIAADILVSLDDEQVRALEANLERDNERLLRPARRHDLEERQERWRRELEDTAEDLMGRLNEAQSQRLAEAAASYRPADELWVAYRQRWQADLLALLERRADEQRFAAAFGHMSRNPEAWYGERYTAVVAHNDTVARALIVDLVDLMSAAQRRRLSDWLTGLATDLEDLAAAR